jgi:hypothetical protein
MHGALIREGVGLSTSTGPGGALQCYASNSFVSCVVAVPTHCHSGGGHPFQKMPQHGVFSACWPKFSHEDVMLEVL